MRCNSNNNNIVLEARLPSPKTRRSGLNSSQLYKIINKIAKYYPDAPVTQRKFPYSKRSINANTLCVPHASTARQAAASNTAKGS